MADQVIPKKVLIVHPFLNVLGGAELVGLRIIAFVLERYNTSVTVLTYKGFDVKKISEYFGLDKYSGRLQFRSVNPPVLFQSASGRFFAMKIAFLHRLAKKICKNYDICISTYNEIDFGRKGLQYIHHPNFASHVFMRSINMPFSKDIREKFQTLDNLYKLLVRLIARQSKEGISMNVTAVNSRFMESIINRLYGIKPMIIYPFLHTSQQSDNLPWEDRKFQFLSVGRISPEKNLVDLLFIFEAISKKYPSAKFVILGRVDNRQYLDELRQAAEKIKHADIKIYTDATDQLRIQFYQESKFYIHSKPYEHFGISVLEAAAAGCLTFIPDSGGMKEIVTSDVLRYQNTNTLIENLMNLIDDPVLRQNALEDLKKSAEYFTIERFDRGIELAMNNLYGNL
jgi:glycosyltransferase involved in cell wall biosynthesis